MNCVTANSQIRNEILKKDTITKSHITKARNISEANRLKRLIFCAFYCHKNFQPNTSILNAE